MKPTKCSSLTVVVAVNPDVVDESFAAFTDDLSKASVVAHPEISIK
jgi:hypothetical protein